MIVRERTWVISMICRVYGFENDIKGAIIKYDMETLVQDRTSV